MGLLLHPSPALPGPADLPAGGAVISASQRKKPAQKDPLSRVPGARVPTHTNLHPELFTRVLKCMVVVVCFFWGVVVLQLPL